MVKLKKIQRKAGISLEKQRLFKMGMLEKNFLVKALCDAQKSSGSETSGEVQSLINKTVNAPKGKLAPQLRHIRLMVPLTWCKLWFEISLYFIASVFI